jgi:hypothetical protein
VFYFFALFLLVLVVLFSFWGAEQTCRGFSVYQGKVCKRTERLMWRMTRQEVLCLAEQRGRRGIVLRLLAPARHDLKTGDQVAMFPLGGTGAEEGAWAVMLLCHGANSLCPSASSAFFTSSLQK